MKHSPFLYILAGLLLAPGTAQSIETNITMELEFRGFPQVDQPASNARQFDNNIAASLEAEVKKGLNNGNTIITFTPFARWDSRDEERRHGDIRELNIVHASGNWETMAGIGKVFWGVTESSHLVDIINQTDQLEGFDGEDKLGQPMLRLSRSFDQSTLTAFVLPWFRERAFLSRDNPLGLPFEVDSDNPRYADDDEEQHIDYAIRFSGYLDVIDYGFSWFEGTAREPELIPGNGEALIPFYPQMQQFGLDLQVTSEAWLWKLELIRRQFDQNPVSSDYTAFVGGLEYSFYGMSDGLFDLGLLLEQHYDSRDNPSTVPFQNDLFLATRLGFNDAESSEILAGIFIDLDDDSTSFRIEGNRRVFDNARISVEVQAFSNVDQGNISYSLRNSDFVRLSLEYFF